MNDGCKLAIAAGIDDPDGPIGTDRLKSWEAIQIRRRYRPCSGDDGYRQRPAQRRNRPRSARSGDGGKGAAAPRRWSEGRWRPPSARLRRQDRKVIADAMNARKPSGFSWVYLRTRLTPPPQRLLTTAMLNRFQSLLTITTACTCVRHQSWSPRWRSFNADLVLEKNGKSSPGQSWIKSLC